MVLYNKYEFLFVTDEDQFRIKNLLKTDYFDFLDPYIFNKVRNYQLMLKKLTSQNSIPESLPDDEHNSDGLL